MMRSSPVFGIAAALILAFCGAEPQLRSRAYDLNAAMPRLADDVNADAQQSQHGAPAPRSDTFTVSNGRDIDAPMEDVTLIGDEKADGTVPSPSDMKGDVNAPMVLSAKDIKDERKQVHEEGREARSTELRKAEDKMIRHTLLDYNPRKRKWMRPSPRLAKICPREMKFASFVSSRFALLKTWCADVDADQCRACAVRRRMELSDKDNGDNVQLDKCESIKVSFLCDNMAEALNEQIARWKHKTAYVQPLFRPKAGFRTAYGEMAACVLGKAEAVLDTLYSLTHCKAGQWSDQKGDDCYRNTVKDLDKDIGQCCAGYEHIVLFEMEATCDSAVLPVLKPIRKLLKKAWDRCLRDPQSCSLVRKKYDKCLRMAKKFSHVPRKPTGEGGVACDYAYSYGGARKIFKLTVKAARDLYAAGGDPRDISPIARKLLHACDRGEPFCSEYIIRFLMKYDEAIGNTHDQ